MAEKIRQDFKDILVKNDSIINTIKTLKVRSDQVAEQSKLEVDEELNIPSNKFMFWAQKVKVYMNNIMTAQITDFKLIESYEKYMKDIISYESQYIDSQTEVMSLRYSIDSLVRIIDNLEDKISEMKENTKNEIPVAEERRDNINPIFTAPIVQPVVPIETKPVEVISKPLVNNLDIANDLTFDENIIEYIKSQGGRVEQKNIQDYFQKDKGTINYWLKKLMADKKIKKIKKGVKNIVVLI